MSNNIDYRRNLAHQKVNNKFAKEVIARFIATIFVGILLVFTLFLVSIKVWSNLCPTGDFLEFLVWYFMISIFINAVICINLESNFKKWKNHKAIVARLYKRQINRFFSYEKKALGK